MKTDYKVILVAEYLEGSFKKLEKLLNEGYRVVEQDKLNEQLFLYTLQRKRLFPNLFRRNIK